MSMIRWGTNFIAAICLVLLYFIFVNRDLLPFSLNGAALQSFKTIFLSIILEAFPFILLGVIVAALLQIFVSERTVQRFVPKHPVAGIIFGCLLGVFFPLCECGMIPVVRRLIMKGMPVYIGIVYILAGPILNPVVYASTFMAFRSRPELVYSRMALAFVVAAIIGWIIYRFVKSNPLKQYASASHHNHTNHTDTTHTHPNTHGNKMFATLGHASDEFFEMGKYLIFGALVTALIQTSFSREWIVAIGEGSISSHLFMMGLAYILSICSTSDAFIASSFLTTFSIGSLLTFLVYGPMLDFKNTLMLLAVFRAKFVWLLIVWISVTVLICSIVMEKLFLT